ncbi:MAG: hypothetical protein NVS2B12_06720 [Ktedonobacteraceae bacterium]
MKQMSTQERFAGLWIGELLLSKIRLCRCVFDTNSLKNIFLIILTLTLFLGSFVIAQTHTTEAHAATSTGAGYTCDWHRVVSGDTLDYIASSYHANIWDLARINHIRNINLIFVGQNLCIDHSTRSGSRSNAGLLSNGDVSWYTYDALDWSNKMQVRALIQAAATRYGLSERLLLAIAWQESGWSQHVISRDGGIGVMQIMPYTAYGLNKQNRTSYDPYKLTDNIELGAIYLRSLMNGFHGNLTPVISGYNEGGWNVVHRGIFNWGYVESVRALMYRF